MYDVWWMWVVKKPAKKEVAQIAEPLPVVVADPVADAANNAVHIYTNILLYSSSS
jgi:hypothetical protein